MTITELHKYIENSRKGIPRLLRILVVLRDNARCSVCGANRDLEIHHIDSLPDNNDHRNLATVCQSCHAKITALDQAILKKGNYIMTELVELINKRKHV